MFPGGYWPPTYYPSRYWERYPVGPPPVPPPAVYTITIPAGSNSATFRYENTVPGLYTLYATPSGGPLAGKGPCSTAQAEIMPTGMRIKSVVVATQLGANPIAYIGRDDINQISILDVLTPGVSVTGMSYRSAPFALPGPPMLAQCKTIWVYGSGMITGGSIIVTPDLNDARAWATGAIGAIPVAQMDESIESVLFYVEPPPDMIGYVFDIWFSNLSGTGVTFHGGKQHIFADLVPIGRQ